MKADDKDKTVPQKENAGTSKKETVVNDNEEKKRKEDVNKGILTASIIGFIVLLIAGIVGYSLYKKEHNQLISQIENQKNTLTDKITARDSVISEWIMTFDEIEKNIATIKEKEKVISTNSSNAELSKDKRQLVLDDIKYINTLLDQNKKKIASLTAQLKNSGGTIKALQNKISELEFSMKKSENLISELKTSLVNKNFKIDQLNTQMTDMQNTIEQKDEKIISQTFEKNKAFFVCGTYKELEAEGLLTKEGGFIGLGRTISLVGNLPDSSFTQIDIFSTLVIPVNSKNAKLISEHPSDSYEFIRNRDKIIEYIGIKDPGKFWKISKYAVVEISR